MKTTTKMMRIAINLLNQMKRMKFSLKKLFSRVDTINTMIITTDTIGDNTVREIEDATTTKEIIEEETHHNFKVSQVI